MVPLGYYIVHRATLPLARLDVGNFHARRDTLTFYPHFLRYNLVEKNSLYFIINGRCDIVLLQPILGASDEAEAKAFYADDARFGDAYQLAKEAFLSLTGERIKDFDDTFFANLRGDHLDVKWNYVELPIKPHELWKISVFVEALFVFSLCKAADQVLLQLLERKDEYRSARDLVDYSQDLVFIEKPGRYFVNKDELDLMNKFYTEWEIGQFVSSLQARFNQVISAYSLLYTQIQASRSLSLNRIAAAAAALALLSVSDTISQTLSFATASQIKMFISGITVLILFYGVAAQTRTKGWIRNIFRTAPLRRRLNRAYFRSKTRK